MSDTDMPESVHDLQVKPFNRNACERCGFLFFAREIREGHESIESFFAYLAYFAGDFPLC